MGKKKITDKVVGTYRVNRGNYEGKKNFFYTSGEYNLDKLIKFSGNILELGRSCVDKNYRNGKKNGSYLGRKNSIKHIYKR